MKKNSVIIIQARMSSNRFPGKMLAHLAGIPLVEYIYKRCKTASLDNVSIATSENKSDDVLFDYCKKRDIRVMRGSLNNVLQRYVQAADSLESEYIVRVCGDTPFVDTAYIGKFLKILIDEKLDYISFDRATCSSGFYFEIVTTQTLEKISGMTTDKEDLEHVTRYLLNNKNTFKTKFVKVNLNPEFARNIRLTIDYPKDMETANTIMETLPDKLNFKSNDILGSLYKNAICTGEK